MMGYCKAWPVPNPFICYVRLEGHSRTKEAAGLNQIYRAFSIRARRKEAAGLSQICRTSSLQVRTKEAGGLNQACEPCSLRATCHPSALTVTHKVFIGMAKYYRKDTK
ncbi:hypothetical protein QYM36_012265 [Artemia franciscana]|uniref:Uncharacterized protein n=1 Tax=Artemia franciscana TaxID=6661 RepID=A0AA88HKG0_ARTSF|nr:hypothetical protein QYM36_012265 [Artemia franciscana]